MHFQFYPKVLPVLTVCMEGVSLLGEERRVSQHVLEGTKLCSICGVRPGQRGQSSLLGPDAFLWAHCPLFLAPLFWWLWGGVSTPQMRRPAWTRAVLGGSLPGWELGSGPWCLGAGSMFLGCGSLCSALPGSGGEQRDSVSWGSGG